MVSEVGSGDDINGTPLPFVVDLFFGSVLVRFAE